MPPQQNSTARGMTLAKPALFQHRAGGSHIHHNQGNQTNHRQVFQRHNYYPPYGINHVERDRCPSIVRVQGWPGSGMAMGFDRGQALWLSLTIAQSLNLRRIPDTHRDLLSRAIARATFNSTLAEMARNL